MKFYLVLACLVVWALPVASKGQSTQPAAPVAPGNDWSVVVSSFADALTRGGDDSLAPPVDSPLTVRLLPRRDLTTLPRITRRTARATLIGAHAYTSLPQSLASDVAEDVKGNLLIPEEARQKLTPEGEDALRQANTTAANWVAQSLGVTKGDVVAVLLFWPAASDDEPIPSKASDLMFVLLKGQPSEAGFRVTAVVAGNPAVKSD